MKVLITGGSGLLGQYLNKYVSEHHEILTLYNRNAGNCGNFKCQRINLTDWKQLKAIFSEFKPDSVIHTAAISRPELCDEMSRSDVMKANTELPENIASLCAEKNAFMIFTSTDLVYDGSSGGMLTEDSPVNPASRYAESKVLAEEKVAAAGGRHLILRTSLLYGFGIGHTRNNFHLAYEKFRRGVKASLFFDQYRTPLALHDSARLVTEMLAALPASGVYNFGGRERISRAGLGKRLCRIAGFDENLVSEISMNDVKTVHKVADVSMNTDKLNSAGLIQSTIDDSITEMLRVIDCNIS